MAEWRDMDMTYEIDGFTDYGSIKMKGGFFIGSIGDVEFKFKNISNVMSKMRKEALRRSYESKEST